MLAVKQFAEVFRCFLCHPVNVSRDGHEVLGDPHSRRSDRRRECATEDARCARVNKASHATRRSFFQKIQCTGDVGIDEVLARMSDDVRLVQSLRVNHRLHTFHAALHESAVSDGADSFCER